MRIAEDDLQGSACKAERVFGWSRHSVQLGLHERRTGLICVDNYQARGRHIFENVFEQNQASDDNPRSLRISIDSKAKVKIGNLSRQGKDRTLEAKEAADHDTAWSAVLVPFGILNLQTNQLSIYFGQSAETSDFIVDCLAAWWQEHHPEAPQIEEWVIDLDGGSATRSNRSQFIKRMVELAQAIGVRIRLIYYPPYHSKYNPIKRCWAVLENYWNGAILDSVAAAVAWAS